MAIHALPMTPTLKYDDYVGRESKDPVEAPIVQWHHFAGIKLTKRESSYLLEVWWHIPLKARYVNYYFLEYLARFCGHAKRRRLCTITWTPHNWRYQSQVKVLPIEGKWTYG